MECESQRGIPLVHFCSQQSGKHERIKRMANLGSKGARNHQDRSKRVDHWEGGKSLLKISREKRGFRESEGCLRVSTQLAHRLRQ